MPTLTWRGKDAVLNHHLEVPYRLLTCDPAPGKRQPDRGACISWNAFEQETRDQLPIPSGNLMPALLRMPLNWKSHAVPQ